MWLGSIATDTGEVVIIEMTSIIETELEFVQIAEKYIGIVRLFCGS